MDVEELKRELLRLANETFPRIALENGYPIIRNHCFLRVVYDNLFQKKWQEALNPKKPAIHQLSETQLRSAIDLGKQVMADRERCEILNRQSLRWRGKLRET